MGCSGPKKQQIRRLLDYLSYISRCTGGHRGWVKSGNPDVVKKNEIFSPSLRDRAGIILVMPILGISASLSYHCRFTVVSLPFDIRPAVVCARHFQIFSLEIVAVRRVFVESSCFVVVVVVGQRPMPCRALGLILGRGPPKSKLSSVKNSEFQEGAPISLSWNDWEIGGELKFSKFCEMFPPLQDRVAYSEN